MTNNNNNNNNQDQQIANLKAQLSAKQSEKAVLKSKVTLVKVFNKVSIPSLMIAVGLAWTGSFSLHPKFDSLEVVPEWNGPDYKVTYKCDNYKQLDNLEMIDNGDTVTVNYGALGRRRQHFICND